MTSKLKVSLHRPYGNETFYPECVSSKILADLLRQKSLTREDVEKLKSLGFEFEVVLSERERKAL